MSIDRLIEKIVKKQNPSVIGLDPKPEYIPPHILRKHITQRGETLQALAGAFYEFNRELIDVLSEIVPAVKPQSAFYEYLGPPGVEAFAETISYAKEKGLYVIADVKRGDIGSTAEAYGEAYLGSVKVGSAEIRAFDCDCVTVNPYLGSDGIRPFLDICRREDKSVLRIGKNIKPVLRRASGPDGGKRQGQRSGRQTD
jgi:orotidine-5'-phosphate decarboxylase